MALAAALRDMRFSPVAADELPDIDIEISVLTPLAPVATADEIVVGRDGVRRHDRRRRDHRRQGHPIHPLLIRFAEVECHLLDRSGNEEQIGLNALRQQTGGIIFINDRCHTSIIAVAGVNHRDTAAPHRDDDDARVDQRLDGVQLNYLLGQWRGHDATPAPTGILDDCPSHLLYAAPGLGLGHEPADRLGWVLKGRIITIHQHLSDDRSHVFIDLALIKPVLEVLLERVTDGALAVCAADIQRHLMHAFVLRCNLRAAQDKADLGTVAVADGNFPARFNHVRNMIRCLFGRLILIFNRLMFRILDQRIAADGHNGNFTGCILSHCGFSCERSRVDKETGSGCDGLDQHVGKIG